MRQKFDLRGVYLGVNARPAKTKPSMNGRSILFRIPFRFLRQAFN